MRHGILKNYLHRAYQQCQLDVEHRASAVATGFQQPKCKRHRLPLQEKLSVIIINIYIIIILPCGKSQLLYISMVRVKPLIYCYHLLHASCWILGCHILVV